MYFVFWCMCIIFCCFVWAFLTIFLGEKTFLTSKDIYNKLTKDNDNQEGEKTKDE